MVVHGRPTAGVLGGHALARGTARCTGAALPVVVLVVVRHWARVVPVWPALTALAAGRAMAGHLPLVDSVEEAAEVVLAAP